MSTPAYYTEEGFKKLQEELHHLHVSIGRAHVEGRVSLHALRALQSPSGGDRALATSQSVAARLQDALRLAAVSSHHL